MFWLAVRDDTIKACTAKATSFAVTVGSVPLFRAAYRARIVGEKYSEMV